MLMDAIWLGGPRDGDLVLCTLSPRDTERFTVLDGEVEVECVFTDTGGRWAIWDAERVANLHPVPAQVYEQQSDQVAESVTRRLVSKGTYRQTVTHTWTEQTLPDGPSYWVLESTGWRTRPTT